MSIFGQLRFLILGANRVAASRTLRALPAIRERVARFIWLFRRGTLLNPPSQPSPNLFLSFTPPPLRLTPFTLSTESCDGCCWKRTDHGAGSGDRSGFRTQPLPMENADICYSITAVRKPTTCDKNPRKEHPSRTQSGSSLRGCWSEKCVVMSDQFRSICGYLAYESVRRLRT